MKNTILTGLIASTLILISGFANSSSDNTEQNTQSFAPESETISLEHDLRTYIETTNKDIENRIWTVTYVFNPATKYLTYTIRNPLLSPREYDQRVEEIAKSYDAEYLSDRAYYHYVGKQGYTIENPPDKEFIFRLPVNFLQGQKMTSFYQDNKFFSNHRSRRNEYAISDDAFRNKLKENCPEYTMPIPAADESISWRHFDEWAVFNIRYTIDGSGKAIDMQVATEKPLKSNASEDLKNYFLNRRIVYPYNIDGKLQQRYVTNQKIEFSYGCKKPFLVKN